MLKRKVKSLFPPTSKDTGFPQLKRFIMIEVVNTKVGSISVKAELADGLSICWRCRGFRTIRVMTYHNPYASWYGGILAAGYYEFCPQCDGIGLFYKTSNRQANG